ncbi:MAG: GNAT family N-acetyltransferase [Chloroflexi bacterium]|nr:MAG: GNAT family N-acetyltransferase [Chloroflexota bacterium]TMG44088.1 MAG: GNAT family N-acetyltransferase [Chloroflexota bacterium]
MNWNTHPPRAQPSEPPGSSITPSTETNSETTSFAISVQGNRVRHGEHVRVTCPSRGDRARRNRATGCSSRFAGQGFAKKAAGALVRWAFEQGEPEVYASASPGNAPSLAVVRALGFT